MHAEEERWYEKAESSLSGHGTMQDPAFGRWRTPPRRGGMLLEENDRSSYMRMDSWVDDGRNDRMRVAGGTDAY
jgi:hypothetical protein